MSADGAHVAFASSDPVTGVDVGCCGDAARQVFARTTFGVARLRKEPLMFAAPVAGFPGAVERELVKNLGPGPLQVTASVRGPFRIVHRCRASVHAGEPCSLKIRHTPPRGSHGKGQQLKKPTRGILTLHIAGTDLDGKVVRVPLVVWRHGVDPGRVEFKEVVVGTESSPTVIRVVNGYDKPVDIASALLEADTTRSPNPPLLLNRLARPIPGEDPPESVADRPFTVDLSATEDDATPGSSYCEDVRPGRTCKIEVAFTPSQLEGQERWLAVGTPSDHLAPAFPGAPVFPLPTWEFVEYVKLTGQAVEPTLNLSPTVAREGRVVFVTGTGFLPGAPVSLGWSGGPVAVPEIIPDANGEFTAPVVVLSGRPGMHELTLTMPGVGTIDAPPVLVVPGSLQPPDFVSRN